VKAIHLGLTSSSPADPRTYTTTPRIEGELDGLPSAERRITMLSEATLPQENEERIAPRELAIARWNLQQFWERRERDRNNEVVGEMLEGWHRFYNEVHSAQMRLVSLAEDVQDEVSRLLSSPADRLVSDLHPFSALGAHSLSPFCPSSGQHSLRSASHTSSN